jgi:hypothetical protein
LYVLGRLLEVASVNISNLASKDYFQDTPRRSPFPYEFRHPSFSILK